MRIEVPQTGMSVKMPTGQIWMSPERDLVYTLPVYIQKALALLDDTNDPFVSLVTQDLYSEHDYDEQITKLIKSLVNFIRLCKEMHESTINEVFTASGYMEVDSEVRHLFEHLLFRIIISAYFAGVKEAEEGHYNTFIYAGPENIAAYLKST